MPSPAKAELRLRRLQTPPPNAITLRDLEPDPVLDALDYEAAPLREWVERILAFRPDLTQEIDAFFERYGDALGDLLCCPALHRLTDIRQLGIKRYPPATQTMFLQGKLRTVTTSPCLHTRLMHVVQVAAHVIAGGLLLKLERNLTAIAACAALLHDVGYGAYGHDGDNVLLAWGYPGHEERGERMVQQDLDIRESLAMMDVDPRAVVVVMREDGFLGRLLSVCDTLAYVCHDARMIGCPLSRSFSYEALASIESLGSDALVVGDEVPLRSMLHVRAELGRGFYFTLTNRIAAVALHQLLQDMRARCALTPEVLAAMTDSEADRFFSGVWFEDTGPSRVRNSLRALTFGFWDELTAWGHIRCPTSESCSTHRGRLVRNKRLPILEIAPWDFTRKQIPVERTIGARLTLKADASLLLDHHREWHLLWFRT